MKSEAFREMIRTGREVRELIAYARKYRDEGGSPSALFGYASIARDAVNQPDLVEYLNEWVEISERAWNEWGQVENPISEIELREWISKQLA